MTDETQKELKSTQEILDYIRNMFKLKTNPMDFTSIEIDGVEYGWAKINLEQNIKIRPSATVVIEPIKALIESGLQESFETGGANFIEVDSLTSAIQNIMLDEKKAAHYINLQLTIRDLMQVKINDRFEMLRDNQSQLKNIYHLDQMLFAFIFSEYGAPLFSLLIGLIQKAQSVSVEN